MKRARLLLLALLTAAALSFASVPAFAAGTAYCVSPSGSDGGDGGASRRASLSRARASTTM